MQQACTSLTLKNRFESVKSENLERICLLHV